MRLRLPTSGVAPAALLTVILLAGTCPGARPALAQYRMSPPRASSQEFDSLKVAYEAHPADEQTALYYARALAARDQIWARRRAVRVLKEALVHHPGSGELHLVLADLYYRQKYVTLARQELQKAVADSTDAAPAYVRLGRIAFRDWLKFQRRESLGVARFHWEESARRDPQDTEPWLGLGILALLVDDGAGAERHARRCLAVASARAGHSRPAGLFPQGARGATPERVAATADPSGEAWLLLGAAAYLQDKPESADSAFSRALPLLRPSARASLLDITPAASDSDTTAWGALAGDSRARAEFLDRFWRSRDPDLTTEVNELRLEFLTRGTLAYFLYFDQRRQAWDERGALLVRYGAPEDVQYNPPQLRGGPLGTNRLMWFYPSLGMDIVLEDRYLNESYDLPISLAAEVDPRPDPEAVAAAVQEGQVAVAGRGLFRPAGRGRVPLGGEARLALFRRVRGFDPVSAAPPAGDAGRVEVYVATHGRPGASGVVAEAVVFDSTWREVARRKIAGTVRCHSDTLQVSQANFDLPPGGYTVGVSARDESRRASAAWRLPVRVPEAWPGRLEISDLELACEYRPDLQGDSFDKSTYAVVPNPGREVARGRTLGVYFEVYGLVPDDAGRSRLSLEYTVRSQRPDRRPFFVKWVSPRREDPRVQVLREDEVPGRVRYQFVSAELADAPPGAYRLEVVVEDRHSGQSVTRALEFTIVP